MKLLLHCVLLVPSLAWSAAPPAAPVPKSPYLPIVYRYADTMLKDGRDTTGPNATGLFLSALDRTTLKPLTQTPPIPRGVEPSARIAATGRNGANPQHDQNLLRLLYTLRGLSGKTNYQQAADQELRWFVENALTDKALAESKFFRPWMLWGRCFEVAPEATRKFATALWNDSAALAKENVSPREAGFLIRTWAEAYKHTSDSLFTNAIAVVLQRLQPRPNARTDFSPPVRTDRTNPFLDGLATPQRHHSDYPFASPAANLSFSIDCDGAAHLVPEPLATQLRAVATQKDAVFCQLQHPLKQSGGFSMAETGPNGFALGRRFPTPLWAAHQGGYTTAQIGMMIVSRYDNTGRPEYRDLMLAAAQCYVDALPDPEADVWPGTLGQAISLQVAAWRHTADAVHLQQARRLADWSVKTFWGDNALPRASSKADHYESITGADTLALALVDLHLQILAITAVRCPPNTIDR